VTQIQVDKGVLDQQSETTLDLEWSHAIAPGAALRFYVASDANGACSFSGFYDAVNAVSADNIASIVSISLGACEQTYTASNLIGAMETEFGALAAQRQGVFVASGDQGAYCPDGSDNTILGVSYPASSAYVTAVGGTRLYLNSNSSYQSEIAWGDACSTGPCGTGGGISSAIAEPSWQSTASLPLPPTGGKRGVPDVALDADPEYGYEIYWTNPDAGCNGICSGFGGTSVGTPEWAGFAAIANQYAKTRLGQVAPILYSPTLLAARQSSQAIYHDVTSGMDGTGAAPYTFTYSATAGWDFTTGWGSVNACHAILALSGAPVVSTATAPAVALSSNRAFLPIVYVNAATC
jgi:kumamolisin